MTLTGIEDEPHMNSTNEQYHDATELNTTNSLVTHKSSTKQNIKIETSKEMLKKPPLTDLTSKLSL